MTARVFHAELWGRRDIKHSRLLDTDVNATEWADLAPQAPLHLFVPRDAALSTKYERGWPVVKVFTVNGVGMTTARDHLVIDFEEEPILRRAAFFRDSRESNAELCRKLRIPQKKGWNITSARNMIQDDDNLRKHIKPVLYRPFDRRLIFYHDSLVWRTVKRVMRHMLAGRNIGLVWTRPMSPNFEFSVTITRCIIDQCGVGNKSAGGGMSYLGPLHAYGLPQNGGFGNGSEAGEVRANRQPNLNPDFVAEMEKKLGLKFVPDGRGNLGLVAEGGERHDHGIGKTSAETSVRRSGTGVPPVNHHGQDAHATNHPQNHGQDAHATGGDGKLQIRHGAYLPHWTFQGAEYFVTFRLADSLPQSVVEAWRAEHQTLLRQTRAGKTALVPSDEERLRNLFSEKVEAYLDAGAGSCWMRRHDVAAIVQEALLHFEQKRYTLLAWCIMPNHVHVVIRPNPRHTLPEIFHSWKSFTSKKISKLLNREGPLWQAEYYDHLIRDEADLNRCMEYTLGNPEKAGINEWNWRGHAMPEGTKSPASESGTGVPPVNHHGQDAHATNHPQNHGQDAHATGTLGPEDVFHYIYAIFHSPTYRKRYVEFLKRDFPRVPLTSNVSLFRKLCHKGADLVALHLVEGDYGAASWNRGKPQGPSPFHNLMSTFPVKGDEVVEKVFYLAPGEPEPGTGRPLPSGKGRVYISKDRPKAEKKGQYFEGVPPEVWEFHVGGYQVCRKWLKDRKGRKLSYDDVQHYHKIVVALNETIRLMAEIDAAIPRWPIE